MCAVSSPLAGKSTVKVIDVKFAFMLTQCHVELKSACSQNSPPSGSSVEVAIPGNAAMIGGCYPYARKLFPSGLTLFVGCGSPIIATRRTHHSTSRFVLASLVHRKSGVLRPDFVGMRRQRSHEHDMQDNTYILPRPPPDKRKGN